jgi:ring-1,2-phenylacetyl-CoA epoxidase subunit PaaD
LEQGITREQILEALADVEDPEVPLNIVEMGLVKSVAVPPAGHIKVELAPCYAACPGRIYILEQVKKRIGEIDPGVEVAWSTEPYWRSSLITLESRKKMRAFSVGIREPGATSMQCPHCGSENTHLEKEFGSSVSKVVFYCDECRNPFEALRGSW